MVQIAKCIRTVSLVKALQNLSCAFCHGFSSFVCIGCFRISIILIFIIYENEVDFLYVLLKFFKSNRLYGNLLSFEDISIQSIVNYL